MNTNLIERLTSSFSQPEGKLCGAFNHFIRIQSAKLKFVFDWTVIILRWQVLPQDTLLFSLLCLCLERVVKCEKLRILYNNCGFLCSEERLTLVTLSDYGVWRPSYYSFLMIVVEFFHDFCLLVILFKELFIIECLVTCGFKFKTTNHMKYYKLPKKLTTQLSMI